MQDGNDVVTVISIQSNPDYLTRLRKIVGCFATSAGMDTKEVQDAKLAVTEACTNAIRHGSPAGLSDQITVKLSSNKGKVVAEISDQGHGFDTSAVLAGPLVETGGLGIMRSLTDEVEFRSNPDGTTVRLVKRAKAQRRLRLRHATR